MCLIDSGAWSGVGSKAAYLLFRVEFFENFREVGELSRADGEVEVRQAAEELGAVAFGEATHDAEAEIGFGLAAGCELREA